MAVTICWNTRKECNNRIFKDIVHSTDECPFVIYVNMKSWTGVLSNKDGLVVIDDFGSMQVLPHQPMEAELMMTAFWGGRHDHRGRTHTMESEASACCYHSHTGCANLPLY